MGQGNSIKKAGGWQQIDMTTSQQIEALKKAGHNAAEIAKQLGYSKRTLERELKRGQVRQLDYEFRYKKCYSAEVSQRHREERATAKGSKIKLGKDFGFAEQVAGHIKDGRSPYGALQLISQNGTSGLIISTRTLYTYIEKGFIPGITQEDLPEGHRKPKRGYKQVRLAHNNTKGTSISERPTEINKRESFGHWEMDCVVSRVGCPQALLVLSERKTREELIFRLQSKTQAEVIRVIDRIEADYGAEKFKRVFASITSDNGGEFLDFKSIERSALNAGQTRTKMYYCHPYSSWERGTNENTNRMIRRFIPKGANIAEYSDEQIAAIQDFINSTPRKILEGYPSRILYEHYTAA